MGRKPWPIAYAFVVAGVRQPKGLVRSRGKRQGSPTRIAWITKEANGRGKRILRETCEEKTSLAHLSRQIEAPQQFSQEGAHTGS